MSNTFARIHRVRERIRVNGQDTTRHMYKISWHSPDKRATWAKPLFPTRLAAERMAFKCGAHVVESEAV